VQELPEHPLDLGQLGHDGVELGVRSNDGASTLPGPVGGGGLYLGLPDLVVGAQTPQILAGKLGGPAIPADGAWLAAHLARPVTVPGAETSGRWRVVIEAVRYQPQRILYVYGPDDVRYIISRRPGPGPGGVLVMTGLAGAGRLAAGYAAAAGAVLVLLAGAALALTRAILRPLRKAAELAESAGQAAGGNPRMGCHAAACGRAPTGAAGRSA
jgi:hypothetical protein